jgi:predicted dehydrogenase
MPAESNPSAAAAAPSPSPLRWGIVSTGHIAGVFAGGLQQSRRGELVGVGSRSAESAQAFAAKWGIDPAHAHGSLAGLLADEAVDAVYVATPHPMHHDAVIAALRAGKHVLCEKPIAMSLADVDGMQQAAREHQRTLMEAWMYRCHPQTQRVVELVADGAIGGLRHMQGAFSFHAPFDSAGRLWNRQLGGGGILDVGGYPLSYARLLAGVAMGQPFADPDELHGVGVLHPETKSDMQASAVLRFPGNITAEISCGTGVAQQNRMRIYGSEGWIEVPSPFVITRDLSPTEIWWQRQDETKPETITITPDRGLYAYEADAFAEAVAAGSLEVPACSWRDTRGNMATQLRWCQQVGVNYA